MKSIIIDGISCIVETIIMVYFIESACKRRPVRLLTSRVHTFFILLLADLGISFLSIPTYIQILVLFSASMLALLIFYTGNILKKDLSKYRVSAFDYCFQPAYLIYCFVGIQH